VFSNSLLFNFGYIAYADNKKEVNLPMSYTTNYSAVVAYDSLNFNPSSTTASNCSIYIKTLSTIGFYMSSHYSSYGVDYITIGY